MHVAIKISTTNDTNGNPRRGWLVFTLRGRSELVAFVDDAYRGQRALTNAYPDAEVIAELDVIPRVYRDAKRGQAEREREAS